MKKTLTFDQAAHANMLFGAMGRNLILIEDELDIEIAQNAQTLTMSGAQADVKMAASALEHLYDEAKQGKEIDDQRVRGALRFEKQNQPHDGSMIITRKKEIKPRSPNQSKYIKALDKHPLVFGLGPAGTGKTYLAVAKAVELLEQGKVDRIILSRPAVEAGERLGFLPGDMKDKIDPYLRPLYDALYDTMGAQNADKKIENGVIEIAPLAFMRGRTLNNAAIILDEAQNTTIMQIKMFMTRLGHHARMFINGDPSQIDLLPREPSGLKDALLVLKDIKEITAITFDEKDVVRHSLVGKIIAAYNRHQAA